MILIAKQLLIDQLRLKISMNSREFWSVFYRLKQMFKWEHNITDFSKKQVILASLFYNLDQFHRRRFFRYVI